MRRTSFSWIPSLVLATAMTCSSGRTDSSQLVVGVQSESMGGVVSALHVVIKVAGAVVTDEVLKPPKGSHAPFPQPWEKTLSGTAGAPVDVSVEAIGIEGPAPLLTRLASTHLVAGRAELLRIQLESRCIVYPPSPRASGKVPGRLSGPTCAAPTTCILGACQSDVVGPASLEPYAPNWATNAPDRCKPVNGGPPILQAGTGQSTYLPLEPMQTLQAEAGPQGGHHIWIAARMKNLKQSLSTTRIEGLQPGTGTPIPPSTFVFSYAPDQGGFCKLYGLRYQLDNGGIDYKQFLGKPLDVTVTVTDPTGATAKSTAHIQIAPTLVNP
ncbi:MAG TPA: hypothetical protein VGL81_34125 [Polyangiaceae bacterium]